MRSFLLPETSLGDLEPDSIAALIAAAADITLVLDPAGLIRDLAVQSDALLHELGDSPAWVGRSLASTLTAESRRKLDALLQREVRCRHLDHVGADGRAVPVLYSCARVEGRLFAFGRDIRAMPALQRHLVKAQQRMERDYARLRDVEMRYRMLFQLSSEAVLILDAGRLRIGEANPAARTMFGVEIGQLAGLGLNEIFTPETYGGVEAHLGSVRAGLRADEVQAQTVPRGKLRGARVTVKASLFRPAGAPLFLLRVAALNDPAPTPSIPDPGWTMPGAGEPIADRIGHALLKDLVREATEAIERLCIEVALERAGNNRASAAGLLGLSRQSLYVKLHRYGLGDLSPDEEG
jgi:PAS domain-containing protein